MGICVLVITACILLYALFHERRYFKNKNTIKAENVHVNSDLKLSPGGGATAPRRYLPTTINLKKEKKKKTRRGNENERRVNRFHQVLPQFKLNLNSLALFVYFYRTEYVVVIKCYLWQEFGP